MIREAGLWDHVRCFRTGQIIPHQIMAMRRCVLSSLPRYLVTSDVSLDSNKMGRDHPPTAAATLLISLEREFTNPEENLRILTDIWNDARDNAT